MQGGVVIKSATGMRSVVAPESLHQWKLRGFEVVGPEAEGADGFHLTVSEWEAEQAARADAVKAALATPTPKAKAKTTTTSAQEG